jgi:hypothetical protein
MMVSNITPHKPPVTGFKPPLNVKKIRVFAPITTKNGANPFEKLGYN